MNAIVRTAVVALCLALAASGCTGGAALGVSSEQARACDIVLDVGDAGAPSVDFGSGVRGASSQRNGRLGISLVASNDQAFAPRAATVRGARAPRVLTSTCYDRDGRPVANPDVTLR